MRVSELTESEFKSLIGQPEYVNAISYANECLDEYGNFKYYQACQMRGKTVTKEQIDIAKEIKIKMISELPSDVLIMNGAGMPCDNEFSNHRVQCTFINNLGVKYGFDFSVGNQQAEIYNLTESEKIQSDLIELFNNYKRDCNKAKREDIREIISKYRKERNELECKSTRGIKYTFKSPDEVLSVVNEKYNCSFKSIRTENYLIGFDYINEARSKIIKVEQLKLF